jgi:hypothetical protein
MKKVILTVLVTFIAATLLQAQDVFLKGDKAVNLGVGLGSYIGGTGYKTTVPPVSISAEWGIKDGLLNGKSSIGLGGYLAYTSNKWETAIPLVGTYGYDYTYFIIGARGLFHYQFIDKLDTYAGLMLGYNVASSKYFGEELSVPVSAASAGGFTYSTFVGAKYYFTPKLAAFAELGYGIAAIELGLSLKF